MRNIENISPTYRQMKKRQEFVAPFTFIFYLQVRDGKRKPFPPIHKCKVVIYIPIYYSSILSLKGI